MCLLHCPSGQLTSSEVELKLGSASMQIHAEPTSGGWRGGGGGGGEWRLVGALSPVNHKGLHQR